MSTLDTILARPLVESLGWTLVHSVWQGAVLAVLLAVILVALRRASAGARYLAACGTLVLMVVVPVTTVAWFPPDHVQTAVRSVDREHALVGGDPKVADGGERVAPAADPLSPDFAATDEMGVPATADTTPFEPRPAPVATLRLAERIDRVLPWLVVAWLVGVLVLSVRLLVGWFGVQRIKRRATLPVSEAWVGALARLARQIRVLRPVRLLESALVEVPTVIGWLRPVILLPASAIAGLTPDQLEALLAHELAHIRRHDYLVNLAQTIVETLLFYHPAVWWVSQQIRVEREESCDELAVRVCGSRLVYARALATMEELRAPDTHVALAASGGSLLSRIRRLLGQPERPVDRSTWWAVAVIAVLLALPMAVGWAERDPQEGLSDNASANQAYVAELPDGVRVELIGVGFHPSDRRKWWDADGRVLQNAPHDSGLPQKPVLKINAGRKQNECREFAVRITGVSGQTSVTAQLIKPTHIENLPRTIVDGQADVTFASGPFSSAETVAFRVGVGLGKYEIVRSIGLDGRKQGDAPAEDELRRVDDLIQPLRVIEDRGETRLVLRQPGDFGIPVDDRIVAIDVSGKPHDRTRSEGRETEWDGVYSLPLAQIARFEYRLKPYHHSVTFDRVSLHARQMTQVKVATQSMAQMPEWRARQDAAVNEPGTASPNDAPNTAGQVATENRNDSDRGWGEVSGGVRCRVTPVASSTSDESPNVNQPTDRFSKPEEITFVVELQNTSDRSINLLGVRYGDSYAPPAPGKLNTAGFGPYLFDFDITDAARMPIQRPERMVLERMLMHSGMSVHAVEPGDSLVILLRPARFSHAMDYRVPPGSYRARVRYRGPTAQVLEEIKKHWPDKAQATAWSGEVTSGEVAFTIADDPAAKKPSLVWGEPKDGLRAAVEFVVKSTPPRPVQRAEAPGVTGPDTAFPHGTKLDIRLHVQNTSDRPIQLVSETWRQEDVVTVTDQAGVEHQLSGSWYSGWPIMVRWKLKPGQTAELPAANIGIAADAESAKKFEHPIGKTLVARPGKYSVRYTIRFGSIQQKDKDGNLVVPGKDDWTGELITGNAPLVVRARTPDDDAADREPTFVGRIEFVGPDGQPIESGTFEARAPAKREALAKGEFRRGPIEIPDCPETPLAITVRAPGYEEALIYDVSLAADAPKQIALTPAAPTRFRLVSSVDGKPVTDAKVRLFNKTSGLASAGPFPPHGIQGPVWATSQGDGRVVLDTLQRVNPHYAKLGDAVYYFYIEPPDTGVPPSRPTGEQPTEVTEDGGPALRLSHPTALAPRFLGPVKAGQDLGDITLGPFLEARGEIRGTPQELDNFVAEWDQPFKLTTDNPDATWVYAVSQPLVTTREGDRLTFHLTGLRPGRLRIMSNFMPGTKSVSHTYGRRDPGKDDIVFEIDLKEPVRDVVITAEKAVSATLPADAPAVKPEDGDARTPTPALDDVAWGEAVGGLQAGLRCPRGKTVLLGDALRAELLVRNTSSDDAKVTYTVGRLEPDVEPGEYEEALKKPDIEAWLTKQPRYEPFWSPYAMNEKGEAVRFRQPVIRSGAVPWHEKSATLEPGQSILVHRGVVQILRDDDSGNLYLNRSVLFVRPGRHKLWGATGVFREGLDFQIELSSGEVELRIQSALSQPVEPGAVQNSADKLSGRLFVNAGLHTKESEGRLFQSAIAIDPNTGGWSRLQTTKADGFSWPISPVRVSADGRTMLFMREKKIDQRTEYELWRCDARTGEGAERVLERGSPTAWSPDGKSFVVVVPKNNAPYLEVESWLVKADTGTHSVLALPDEDAVEDWSADGQWLLVVSRKSGQISLVKPDGSGRRRITAVADYSSFNEPRPRISPDGRRIVYLRVHRTGDEDARIATYSLRTINIDGTADREILGDRQVDSTSGTTISTSPLTARWSPTGKHLAVVLFDHTRDGGVLALNGNWRLAIIDADGGNLRELKLEGVLNTVLPWDGVEWRPVASRGASSRPYPEARPAR